ncbi:hypothetical protein AgCh_035109 [Apium graveolens]
MGSWRSWFSFKNSLVHHSRSMPFKLTSFLKHKTKENKAGLMSLYKDMEACEGAAVFSGYQGENAKDIHGMS